MFVSAISSIIINKIVQEALSHSRWRHAMLDEMQALESYHTWVLVPPPPWKSVVGCQYVINVKVGPDGQMDGAIHCEGDHFVFFRCSL